MMSKEKGKNKAVFKEARGEALSGFLYSFSSVLINLACLVFVTYQTHKCVTKLAHEPTVTDVSITKASEHPYPAITVCFKDSYNASSEILKKCNLTYFQFFYHSVYVGNGSEEFCQNPAKLYEEMGRNMFSELINAAFPPYVSFVNDTSLWRHLLTFDNFTIVQSFYDDVCYSYEVEVPEHMRFKLFAIVFQQNASIYVHTPGSFYGPDYGHFYFHAKTMEIDVFHEVFETSHACQQNGRDHCIYQTIFDVNSLEF